MQVQVAALPPAAVAAADSAVAAAFVGRRGADGLVGGGGPGLLLSVGKGFARQRLQGAAPAQAACAPSHIIYSPSFPMDSSIKTSNPKCRLYWCLTDFIDWRHSQSCWNFFCGEHIHEYR